MLPRSNQGAEPRKWHIVNADGLVVGRAAVMIANVLRGKHKTSFNPRVDCGDGVVVINADKIRFTGNKAAKKVYYKHTGYPGGIKGVTAAKVLKSGLPERVLEKAVERVIPRGPLGRQQLRNLRVFAGPEHAEVMPDAQVIDVAVLNRKLKYGV